MAVKLALQEIRHDQTGFAELVDLAAQVKSCFLEQIDIDMRSTTWFDADMCAAFGAILYRLGHKLNIVRLLNIPGKVETILSKNGFLSTYGRNPVSDTWGTTIPYHRFEIKDERFFASYIERELVQRPEIPAMSPRLLKRFRESVFEVFSNAVIHSETELGIFSCGQFFPKGTRLVFSVADLGIGIRDNVSRKTGCNLTPEQAIACAVEGRNTTKNGPIPGGLGLKLLREFIKLNQGTFVIASDKGYWELREGRVRTARLANEFPGTVVTIEINTADTHSYALSSEISPSDIF